MTFFAMPELSSVSGLPCPLAQKTANAVPYCGLTENPHLPVWPQDIVRELTAHFASKIDPLQHE
jgi:hypothetical protein